MGRVVGPAPLHKGTFVRLVTVESDRNVGKRSREELELRVDFPAYLGQQRLNRLRHVRLRE